MKLTGKKLIEIEVKFILPICLMIKAATLHIDISALFLLGLIVCNYLAFKDREPDRLDILLVTLVTVATVLQVLIS